MIDEPPPKPRRFGLKDGLVLGGVIASIPVGLVIVYVLCFAGFIGWLFAKTLFEIFLYPFLGPILQAVASVAALAAGIWLVIKLNAKLPEGKVRRGSIGAIFLELARTYTIGAVFLVTLACILWICFLWRPA